ncbi:UNVERIFIED_CONTAM: hypothetical protein PYX00_000951 [Menopon gallinae]|uniref:Septin-7 n=1 Tax=Menopon gallinae TaxID=328185 RepID=A0AAW2IAH5_9NEOP
MENGNLTNGSANTNGAAVKMTSSRPAGNGLSSPGSYMYTSSASLLTQREKPPIMPKYQGYTSASIGASYRLSSMDRLANRPKPGDGTATGQTATGASEDKPTSLQSKRELFFKNELPTSGGVVAPQLPSNGPTLGSTNTAPTPNPSAIKESITKRVVENGDGETKTGYTKPAETKRPKELDGYVGFANLPNQVYRKAVKKGFEFTLMIVGESGLGKSTLINSLFLADIYSNEYPGPSLRPKKTVTVETTKTLLKENGVNLALTVVDTPGFGDAVDNTSCWQPVIEYIESRYEEFLNAESRVNRKSVPDNRVHCCLYMIAPSGHGLKPLDVELMKRLHDKVNLIPLIAKADTMTPEECAHFKKQVMQEIGQHKIKIYEFPDSTEEEETKLHKVLKERVPFAVVGSNCIVEVDGKKVRGRKYPWGIAEVENLEHCDFIALRNMVLRTHLQDLKEVTNNVHYENYRFRALAGLAPDGKPARLTNKNPLAQMEEEKREHDIKMKKMEVEMEQVFEMKVREKKQKLKDSEADLQRRHEQMRKSLELQLQELEEKRKAFEKEKQQWELNNGVTIEELRRRSLEANSKENSKSSRRAYQSLIPAATTNTILSSSIQFIGKFK